MWQSAAKVIVSDIWHAVSAPGRRLGDCPRPVPRLQPGVLVIVCIATRLGGGQGAGDQRTEANALSRMAARRCLEPVENDDLRAVPPARSASTHPCQFICQAWSEGVEPDSGASRPMREHQPSLRDGSLTSSREQAAHGPLPPTGVLARTVMPVTGRRPRVPTGHGRQLAPHGPPVRPLPHPHRHASVPMRAGPRPDSAAEVAWSRTGRTRGSGPGSLRAARVPPWLTGWSARPLSRSPSSVP